MSKEKNEKMRELQTVLDHNGICRSRRILRRKAFSFPGCRWNLPEILGYEKTVELIHESDQIYLDFGADKNVYGVDKEKEIREIRRRAINANLKLIECPIRHLGTEEGYKIYSRLEDHLKEIGVEMKFNTMVNDITIEDGRATAVHLRTERFTRQMRLSPQ